MTQYTITPIGFIRQTEGGTVLKLKKEYLPAMQNLAGFGHLQVLWWFDGCDTPACRKNLVEESPLCRGPAAVWRICHPLATAAQPHRTNLLRRDVSR